MADGHGRARTDRSIAGQFMRGIAVGVRDGFERNAEPLGDHRRKHRGMALAGVLHVERQQKMLAAGKAQHGAFERRAAGMFEHAGNAEPAIFAALGRFALALLEVVVVGKLQRLVEDRLEVAGVVGGADRGLVRHLRFLDQIAPPQLHRIDAGQARRLVHQALEHVIGFRPAGAAIGRGRDRVGEDAFGRHVDALDVVHAGQAAGEIEARNIGADGADIGAHIAGIADAQRQDLALLVERKLGLGIDVAALIVGEEGFRAARHPVDRPAGLLGADEEREIFGIGRGLQPEGAADIFGDDAQLLLRPAHDGQHVRRAWRRRPASRCATDSCRSRHRSSRWRRAAPSRRRRDADSSPPCARRIWRTQTAARPRRHWRRARRAARPNRRRYFPALPARSAARRA